MASFVLNENSEEYKSLLWEQFRYSSKKQYLGNQNRIGTIIFLTIPILFLIAFFANHSVNNLVVCCMFGIVIGFKTIIFFLQRKLLIEKIKDLVNSKPYTITLDEKSIKFQNTEIESIINWENFLEFEEFNGNVILHFKQKFQKPIFLPLSLIGEKQIIQNIIYSKVKKKK